MSAVALVLIGLLSTQAQVEQDLARVAAALGEIPTLEAILDPTSAGPEPGAWLDYETMAIVQALAEEAEARRGAGDYEGSLALARQSLELNVAHLGADHAAATAARLTVEMLERACALKLAERRELAAADGLTARILGLYGNEEFAEADRLLREQMAVHARLLGDATPDRATNLRNRAMLLDGQSRFDEELGLALEAYDLRMRLYGDEHVDIPDALHQIGLTLGRLERYEESERFLRASLARQARLTGLDGDMAMPMAGDLAETLQHLGRYEAAERLYDRILATYEAADARDPMVRYGMARALDAFGVLLMHVGDLDRADESMNRALELRLSVLGRESGEVAASLNNLQELDRIRGDLARAEGRARESLEIRRKLGRQDRIVVGERNLSQLLFEKGDLEGAEHHARAALAIPGELLPHARAQRAWSLSQLGIVLLAGGRIEEARELLVEAEQLQAEAVGRAHPDWALVASNLAHALRLSGRTAEAQALYERVLEVRRELLGAAHPSVGRTLEALSILTIDQGDAAKAETLAAEALKIARRALGPKDPATARAHALLGRLAALRGALELAEEHLSLALDATDGLRADVAGLESERARFASARLKQPTIARRLADVLVRRGRTAQALEASERGLARELLDLLARTDVDLLAVAGDSPASKNLKALTARAATLRARVISAETLLARRGFDDADAARGVLEARQALRAAEASLLVEVHDAIPESRPASAAEVRAALRPGELLLALIDSEDGASWLAVPPAGTDEIRAHSIASSAADRSALQDAADRARDAVESGSEDARAMLAALAELLLPEELVKASLASARLILVADALAGIPFAALPVRGAHRELLPLVESGPELVLAPSASVFVDRRARAAAQGHSDPAREIALVALGDPNFAGPAGGTREASAAGASSDPLIRSALDALRLRDGRLPRLAGSRLEALELAALASAAGGSAQVLLGPDATVKRLEESLAGATHVHLATHGILGSSARPMDSALALSPPETPSDDDLGYLTLDHMLRTWRGRMPSCELVVLSACQSGVGARLGDAEISLPWGLFYAGAPAVVVSLWKVDDGATTLLMRRFYENLLGLHDEPRTACGRTFGPGEPLTKPAALGEAQAWLRARTPAENRAALGALGSSEATRSDGGPPGPSEAPTTRSAEARFDFSAPRYWAPFVLVGAPD